MMTIIWEEMNFTMNSSPSLRLLMKEMFLKEADTVRYSWWSYRFRARENNAGWRIDYFLVSDRIKERVSAAEILTDVMGSDHCPVLLEII